MAGRWTLGWRNYARFAGVQVDPARTTFVAGYQDEGLVAEGLGGLSRLLTGERMAIQRLGGRDFVRATVATSGGTLRVVFNDTDRTRITATCLDEASAALVEGYLRGSARPPSTLGTVRHERLAFDPGGTRLRGELRTGLPLKEGDLSRFLYPCTFFRFTEGGRLVARCLLEYHNGETGESAPTILMIEVLRDRRGEGLGTEVLAWLEGRVRGQGFDRIWASSARSSRFWQKHGFEIDGEEGVKRLGGSAGSP
ncbi:MAG: GNAT family N-acetyltransferase [Nitrososphaerales archaeon]|jgi:GNAT superfamily N-acetyltransferase